MGSEAETEEEKDDENMREKKEKNEKHKEKRLIIYPIASLSSVVGLYEEHMWWDDVVHRAL